MFLPVGLRLHRTDAPLPVRRGPGGWGKVGLGEGDHPACNGQSEAMKREGWGYDQDTSGTRT